VRWKIVLLPANATSIHKDWKVIGTSTRHEQPTNTPDHSRGDAQYSLCIRASRNLSHYLLTVNRSIRAEAKQLWYTSNEFQFWIADYDARLLKLFHRRVCAMLTRRAIAHVQYSMRLGGAPQWANLKAWSSAASTEKCALPDFPADGSAVPENITAAVAALGMSEVMASMLAMDRDRAWSDFRRVAGLADARWLEDR